ncbi:MAG TPA: SurA N-terminal domain-containing protein [Candidatus Bathyarchaeia archaeon]|nr:SurA N-terminal domain-containing protein [Candidatus Bathyarchaeia archaeon]
MKPIRQFAICALLLLPAAATAGEVIDGVIATVNRTPVLQSEWDDATRFEAFMQQKPLSEVTGKDRVRALQRLIDRRLLEVQMGNPGYLAPSRDELRSNLAKLRAQIPAAQEDAGWQAVMASYGLTQRQIEDHLRAEMQMMSFLEVRLRPNAHVQPEEVEAYYRAQVLPDLEKAGVKLVTLQEVEPRIRELLVQQHMDELLDAWLHNLRLQTPVHSSVPLPAAPEREAMGGN